MGKLCLHTMTNFFGAPMLSGAGGSKMGANTKLGPRTENIRMKKGSFCALLVLRSSAPFLGIVISWQLREQKMVSSHGSVWVDTEKRKRWKYGQGVSLPLLHRLCLCSSLNLFFCFFLSVVGSNRRGRETNRSKGQQRPQR